MGAVSVFFYGNRGSSPLLDWLRSIPERAYAKGIARIDRLKSLGHELRRPEADYLRDGIYELRWRLGRVNYRILYFFHDRDTLVLVHGLTKEAEIRNNDIALAITRKTAYYKNPEEHAYTK